MAPLGIRVCKTQAKAACPGPGHKLNASASSYEPVSYIEPQATPGHSPGHHRKPLGFRHPIQISLHLTVPLEKRLILLAAHTFPFPGLQDPLTSQHRAHRLPRS